MTQRHFFLFSTLLHLLAGTLVYFGVRLSADVKNQTLVQLTLENQKTTKTTSSKPKRPRFQLRTTLNSGLSKKSFGLLPSKTSDAQWAQAEDFQTDDIEKFQGLSMKQAQFLKTVWTEINESIVNSPYLAEYGQIGTVQLQFEIDPNGLLIGKTLKAKAENSVLKVLAARSIRKALRSDNLDLSAPNEVVKIFAKFEWTDGIPCDAHQGLNKNYLSFCRVSKSQRKSFSKSEKAAAYLSSLQYGFSAMEAIKEYKKEENRRNTQFDPFQDLKRDLDWNLGS